MKTKIIVLLAIAAVATLSFTYKASSKTTKVVVPKSSAQNQTNEPLGGFISEDKF